VAGADEAELVRRLQAGDEDAFVEVVTRHHAALVRAARAYVASDAVAEEVVQDTWVGVIRGIERFEGRSSLTTWLFHIMANRARSTGVRESRTTPFDASDAESAPPELFTREGAWAEPPRPWTDDVEDRLVAEQAAQHVRRCLEGLPDAQRVVVTMRDVDGLGPEEVCSALGVSAGNQRVLLHRGRARVRACLSARLGGLA
jgi:RNA polymerase sigma-70 factor (ECF subfamily)